MKNIQKTKLLKTILIPTLGMSAIGTIAAVSTSCGSKNPDIDVAEYIGITANADSTLELVNKSFRNYINLSYSENGINWNTYSEEISINQGQTLYLKGDNHTGWSTSNSVYSYLSITGDVSISGNVMGLLDNGTITGEKGDITDIPCDCCFFNLFKNSTEITSVSEDFLPAITLTDYCYQNMFIGCSSLTTAPKLPATTLKDACYTYMFNNCVSLTIPPELSATTLASNCCAYMFYNCTSLTSAPNLPATSLARNCYTNMFELCSSLNSIRISYTGDYDSTYFNGWVSGVASSGTFYYNSRQTAQDFKLPSGWGRRW